MIERYRPKRVPGEGVAEEKASEPEPKRRPKGKSHVTTFTEAAVRRYLPPAEGQVDFFEKLRRGLTLVLRISYGGAKAWRVVWYAGGRPKTKTLGRYPDMGVKAAREAAFAFDTKAETASAAAGLFKEVAEQWLELYVAKKGLRSRGEIERQLAKYVYPEWERRPFFEIRRREVNELLDKLVKERGAGCADAVLATLRSIANWFQSRDEEYVSPIVKGMRRDQRRASDRARKRILTDDEIRTVWTAASDVGTYGALVRILLLTAQRKAKVATMRRSDLSDGVWTIRAEPREKGNAGAIKLPQQALDIVEAQPRVEGNDYVFAGRGETAFNHWSDAKTELDEKLPAEMPRWVLHDLRRTARSLMSRAGVAREIAERVLGHAIPGVEGTYDRYPYLAEKSDALDKLATLIDTIINPPDKSNVVELASARA